MKPVVHGELEIQILKIIWEKKDCSPREVLDEIQKERDMALTTISTVLGRLHTKRVLIRKKTKGRVRYSPKLSKEAYGANTVKEFVDSLVDSFGNTAITSFAKGVKGLPDDQLKKLIYLLRKYENK